MPKIGQKTVILIASPVILTLALTFGCRGGGQPSPELQALLAADTLDRQVGDAQVRTAVRAFYTETGSTLAWTHGRPTRTTDAALAVLASAPRHGLNDEEYQVTALRADRDLLSRQPARERHKALATFDVRLTAALIRLGRDVSVGRVDPRAVDSRWRRARRLPPLGASLAAARNDVSKWLDGLQPPHPEYGRLVDGLAALRGVEAKGGWPAVPHARLAPGSSNAAVPILRRRLAASGDLGSAAIDGARFDSALENALGVFQEHHGLSKSGRLDAATRVALNVPLGTRIRQVALNLERWRWAPEDLGERHFRVNIPYYHLEAFEQGRLALDIRAVVGKRGNETPVFSERMTHVVLSPYWNIPTSIAEGETLPAVATNPSYLEAQNIEVVRVSGNKASIVDPATLDWADAAALEGLRFRQRPGASNALGFVKFMFPNPYDVYVHDTPADRLFGRLGRAFSHGCVRVEEPLALATYVLRDQPRWTPEAIAQAMHGGEETHVKLKAPIPIHIQYFTAWVDANGGLQFRDDVYGFDATQAAAGLRRRPVRRNL